MSSTSARHDVPSGSGRHSPLHDDQVRVDRGTFTMGSADFYPEERPLRRRSVDAFAMDRTPVTVEQFACFVADTGWVTFAVACVRGAGNSLGRPGATTWYSSSASGSPARVNAPMLRAVVPSGHSSARAW